MTITIVEFSIVLTANDHNPSILNPDFLERNGIVKDNWGWEISSPPISTPPFATVQYNGNISIAVESNKLSVTDRSDLDNPCDSKVKDIVLSYTKLLSHVRYIGIGANFKCFSPVDGGRSFLKERFLKDGSWDSDDMPIVDSGYSFSYELKSSGQMTFNVASGLLTLREIDQEIEKAGLTFTANCHREIKSLPGTKEIEEYLNLLPDDWKAFKNIQSRILGGE